MAIYPYMENITEDEQRFFNEWIAKGDNKELFDSIVDNETRKADLAKFLQIKNTQNANREKYYAAVEAALNKNKVSRRKSWPYYIAAASVIVALSIVCYVWFIGKQKTSETETPTIVKINDVKPGQYKAKLTLDDGTTIILDSTKSDTLLVQEGDMFVLNKNGKLVYEKHGETNKVLYNTLSTAKAQTYATVLSDGTKVWLNSESSIHYPVAFSGDFRKVEITGEAYFEVARSIGSNGKRPFVVEVNGMEVEVLGTHFNINSYSDEEAIKTTLLEGKIRVRNISNNAEAMLKPGEQAVFRQGQNNKLSINKDIDVDAEVAWRFGYFNFNNADLKTMMRQLQRWYDVDVVYEGEIPDVQFLGEIPRELSLSQVLNVLQKQAIHFKMVGKKIIVTP
jgi:ferric-dicitrate binding protein FerR (iron transport regulator)